MTAQQQRINQLKSLDYSHVSGIVGRNTVVMTKSTASGRYTSYVQTTGRITHSQS